jgi:hypothetical protein
LDPVIKSHDCINENTGDGEGVQHLVQQLAVKRNCNSNLSDSATMLIWAETKEVVKTCQATLEKLRGNAGEKDHIVFGILSSILASLKEASERLGQFEQIHPAEPE